MKVAPIEKNEFNTVLDNLRVPTEINHEYLYDLYSSVCGAIEDVTQQSSLNNLTPVNHVILILYIINEFNFQFSRLQPVDRAKFEDNDAFYSSVASVSADKFITNEELNYKSELFLSRFNPSISTIELYLNFCLHSLESVDVNKLNQADRLVKEMLEKAFKMSKCIMSLLTQGFETEAFSTWRTLHESESILTLLVKYSKVLFQSYFKHIKYALAYRGQLGTKEETDKTFEQIKSEMKSFDLKSKDMKKYIEYGYLFSIPDIKLNEDFKLNFRDGIEKMAGLSSYSKVYEMASEIAHSSPVLLYSNRAYFLDLTILYTYESFFRLESIFNSFYTVFSTPKQINQYQELRKMYLSQMIEIHDTVKGHIIKNYAKEPDQPLSETIE
ncbi:MAG: hypothetical protein H6689_03475 [Erysipelotrichaceae bacterium]|nr:hypothetical protein [Erysipelotrichaceae bacterium]